MNRPCTSVWNLRWAVDVARVWRDLIPFLNSLRVDHLVLEFARRGTTNWPYFPTSIQDCLGIGLIDKKITKLRSPELIASRMKICEDAWPAAAVRPSDWVSGCCSGASQDRKMRCFGGRVERSFETDGYKDNFHPEDRPEYACGQQYR